MSDSYFDVLQRNFRLKANQQPFRASVSGPLAGGGGGGGIEKLFNAEGLHVDGV